MEKTQISQQNGLADEGKAILSRKQSGPLDDAVGKLLQGEIQEKKIFK